MKKVFGFIIVVLFSLLFAWSCAKDELPAQVEVPEAPQMTFTASIEGGLDTRTQLVTGEDDPQDKPSYVSWTSNDAIKAYSGTYSGMMSFDGISDEGYATFTGESIDGDPVDNYKYWAMYPYTCVSSFSGGTFTANLPDKQYGLANSFAEDVSFTIARTKDTHFHFYNACSGIRFKIDAASLSSEKISKVTIFANNGEAFAGKFTTGFGSDGLPVTKSVSSSSVSRISLVPASGDSFTTGTWYYIITLPVELQNGFTMALEGGEVVRTFSYTKSLTFNRSKFRSVTLKSSNSPKVTRQEDEDADNAPYYITSSKEREYIGLANRSYANDLGTSGYTTSIFKSNSGGGGSPGGGSSGSSSFRYSSDDQYPDAIPFKWSSNTYSNAVKLEFSDDPSFSTSTVITFSSGTESINVYNLFPEVTYYYRLYDSSRSVIGGLRSVTPKGPIRTIKSVESNGVKNFRDLGGWSAEGGKTIKFGKIYRGYNIDDISGDSKSTIINETNSLTGSGPYFVSLGIKHDLDLRGHSQNTGDENNALGWAKPEYYNNIPVIQFMYNNKTSGLTSARYQCALRYIISCVKKNEPVYFHCIGGADRTGTLAFLIEALLGVSELDMNIDYELTSFNSTRARNSTGNCPFKYLVQYLYSFDGDNLQEKVTNWAMTSFADESNYSDYNSAYSNKPLTMDEINTLKELMLE